MSWTKLTPDQQNLALRTLTPSQLRVFQDRLNGHPWARIATAMNLDEATIRGHHKRAIRRITNAQKDAAT